jgi:hypothetical protein
MRPLIFLTLLAGLAKCAISCDKESNTNGLTDKSTSEITNDVIGNLEFYLITSFDTLKNTYKINAQSVKYGDAALIENDDIISYDSANYTFKISDAAKLKIKNLKHSVRGLAFGVVANKNLIYTGYFWPGYSSLSCDWIVIDPLFVDLKSEMNVRLGYPGYSDYMKITDYRNDKRIIDILTRDKKLTE